MGGWRAGKGKKHFKMKDRRESTGRGRGEENSQPAVTESKSGKEYKSNEVAEKRRRKLRMVVLCPA